MFPLIALIGAAPLLLPLSLSGTVAATPAAVLAAPFLSVASADSAPSFAEARLAVLCAADARFEDMRVVGDVRAFTMRCGAERPVEFAVEPANGEPRMMTARVRAIDAQVFESVASTACAGAVEVLHHTARACVQRCGTGNERVLATILHEGDDLHFIAAVLP